MNMLSCKKACPQSANQTTKTEQKGIIHYDNILGLYANIAPR